MNLVPRNTLVIVELIEGPKQKVGSITIPNNGDLFGEAIVVAVGPGTVNDSQKSETHDLKPGQIVLVKHQDVRPVGSSHVKNKAGLEYRDGDRKLLILEQMYVLAILSKSPSGSSRPRRNSPRDIQEVGK